MKGLGTDDDLLIELVCTRSSEELAQAAATYSRMHGRELASAVEAETSGDLQKLLLGLVKTPHEEVVVPDLAAAAAELREAMDGFGTDEAALIAVVCKAAPETWAAERLPKVYAETFEGRSLAADIEAETSGSFQRALVQKVSPSRWHVWARLLHRAGPEKLGTDEDTVVRVLSSCQSEGLSYCDSLDRLAATYEEVYGSPLLAMLRDELSGTVLQVVTQLVVCPTGVDGEC